jgi:hypothetical protein
MLPLRLLSLTMWEHFNREGSKIIAKVAKHQRAAHMKIRALLVPREMKVEQSGPVAAMSDEQLDEALLALWEYSRRAPPRRRTRLRELRRWRSGLPRRSPSLLPRPRRQN